MTVSSFPFEDRQTSEAEFSQMFKYFIRSGVKPGTFQVSADSSGMRVTVSQGDGFVRGIFVTSTATETLNIAGSSANPRIDTVILRLDLNANSIVLAVKQGAAAASPSRPALTQTDFDVYELPLADVRVGGGAVTIAASNVTDRRTYVSEGTSTWTDSTRPVSYARSTLGFNTTSGLWEYHDGSSLKQIPRWSAGSGLEGRTIHVSDSPPSNSQGENGDIWFEF